MRLILINARGAGLMDTEKRPGNRISRKGKSMRTHFEHFFGFTLDPGPRDLDVNRPIQIKIIAGEKDQTEQWTTYAPWFCATKLDDLIRVLQCAKRVLETECRRDKEGYFSPHRFF